MTPAFSACRRATRIGAGRSSWWGSWHAGAGRSAWLSAALGRACQETIKIHQESFGQNCYVVIPDTVRVALCRASTGIAYTLRRAAAVYAHR